MSEAEKNGKKKSYYRMYRGWKDSEFLKNDPKRICCWSDLIEMASWDDREYEFNNVTHPLRRGQLVTSRRYLEERWRKWAVSERFVRTLLKDAKNDQAIDLLESGNATIITIVNYDIYQGGRPTLEGESDPRNDPLPPPDVTHPATHPSHTLPYKERRKKEEKKEEKKYTKEEDRAHAHEETSDEEKITEEATPKPAVQASMFETRKEEPRKEYTLELEVIRLLPRDFDAWKQGFPHVDLLPFLIERDAWLRTRSEKERKNWFLPTSQALAKENDRKARAKSLTATEPDDPQKEIRAQFAADEREQRIREGQEYAVAAAEMGLTDDVLRRMYAEQDEKAKERLAKAAAPAPEPAKPRQIPLVAMEPIPVPKLRPGAPPRQPRGSSEA